MKSRLIAEIKIPEETEGLCVLKLKIRFAIHVQENICKSMQACILEITHSLPPDRQIPFSEPSLSC